MLPSRQVLTAGAAGHVMPRGAAQQTNKEVSIKKPNHVMRASLCNDSNTRCLTELIPCLADSFCPAGACSTPDTNQCQAPPGICNPMDGSCSYAAAAAGTGCAGNGSCTPAGACQLPGGHLGLPRFTVAFWPRKKDVRYERQQPFPRL